MILGLDPRTSVMGYSIIIILGSKLTLLQFRVIHLSKLESHEVRLKKIFERLLSLLVELNPDEAALEAPFFGKNIQSLLKLGGAQGEANTTPSSVFSGRENQNRGS